MDGHPNLLNFSYLSPTIRINYIYNKCWHFTFNVLKKIQDAPDKLWIITDVRFENEVKFIREQKGKIILLERDGYNYDNHPSEMGILDFDFKIQNTTIEDLENQIKIVLKEIL